MRGHRSRRADRAPGRCRAGEGYAWRLILTGRFVENDFNDRRGDSELGLSAGLSFPCLGVPWSILLDLQQLGGFGAEVAEFAAEFIVSFFLHTLDGLAVSFAGLFLLAQLPMGHGQEEPVGAVATVAKLHRPLQGRYRVPPVASTVMGDSQGVPNTPNVGRKPDGFFRQNNR